MGSYEPESSPRQKSSDGRWEQFPCDQCGASLHYSPGAQALSCGYCGNVNAIPQIDLRVEEQPLKETLARLDEVLESRTELTVSCEECGAEYTLPEDIHSAKCDFCGTPVVAETTEHRQLSPQGVLPFSITQASADQAFSDWLGRLWLAPSKLKKHARGESHLKGLYTPYWTYDSDSHAAYKGMRGTYYQVSQRVQVVVNGRTQWRTQMVTKVRWSPVSGQVKRWFDDVLVIGSHSLPTHIVNRLRSWRLDALEPYQGAWLSGFSSELYQRGPEESFVEAAQIMDEGLRRQIVNDIGGDQQRITHMRSWHQNVHFKHILLPLWVAAYRFRGKSYRFVVNGQTGEVQGERPYSTWKIAGLVLLGLVAVGGLFWMAENGYFDTVLNARNQGFSTGGYNVRY